MPINPSHSGWSRVSPGVDVEVQHGVPVRLTSNNINQQLTNKRISEKIHDLTGFKVSVHNRINISPDEQEWTVCVDTKEFDEVLRRLALSSAAMFVDRFHKPIDHNAVDWDDAQFNYDYNHAIEHCCIPWESLDKASYYKRYISIMHAESVRLVYEGIAPMVEAE